MGRAWILLLAGALLLAAGCATPTGTEKAPVRVNMVSPHYPPAVAGTPGWEYHQTLQADLNGDGQKERVSVITNAVWVPERKEFGWDDGHPWHVYVEAADGSRTYLFSNWVQLGKLDVIFDPESRNLFIVSLRGGGMVVYRATYHRPGEADLYQVFEIPLGEPATWADPQRFAP